MSVFQLEMELPAANRAPAVRSSPTSVAAAASITPHLSRLEAEVLGHFRDAGPLGLTCDELERISGMTHQTASARVVGLKKRNRVEDSGRERKTRSGRPATVWRIVF